MIRPRGRTVSAVGAFVAAMLAACASKTDGEKFGVASSDLTAGDAGDPGSAQVTLCHMPPGNPANLTLITVGAAAASTFEAKGDGVCSSGASDCCLESGPTSLCTNFSTDAANCGGCGAACPVTGQICSNGQCVCPPGDLLCGSACVNASSDNANCGGCGIVCGTDAFCSNGACACPPREQICNNTCVSEQDDPDNCGGCGTTCDQANGFVCSAGTCVCSGPPYQCGTCPLAPVPSGQFVPIYGTVNLTGSVSVPTAGGVIIPEGCFPLGPPIPTSGLLTFVINATNCSFTYNDSESGVTYLTNLSGSGFDGDTYTCGGGGPPGDIASIHSACFELGGLEDGIDGSVTLTVTRSTGAVSLFRQCTYADGTCEVGGYVLNNPNSTTSFQLNGVLSCPDGLNTQPVACAETTCSSPSEFCCSLPVLPDAGGIIGITKSGCLDTAGGQCLIPGTPLTCSGAASCPAGFVCCLSGGFGPLGSSGCWVETCPSGTQPF